MSLDTRERYKVVKVKDERLVKTLLNKIVIKLRETNDMVYFTSIERGDTYCLSKSQVALKPYFDLRGQDSVNQMLQGCSFDSIVAIDGGQYSRLLEQYAKARGITLEIHEDHKVDIKTTITTKDFLDACDYLIREEKYDYDKYILGVRSGKSIFQKDLMKTLDDYKYFHFSLEEDYVFPTKVFFNKDKEKVTLLFSKNGKIPYESYSSKTSGKDTYDREFGLYLSYYKYLNKGRDNKEFIDSIFKQKLKGEKLAYLKGAVHDIVKKQLTEIGAFENLVKEILKCEFEWDLHEHEAKLKLKKEREKRIKERSSQIALKEKEIESLRKQNDKETLNYLKASTPKEVRDYINANMPKDKLPFE